VLSIALLQLAVLHPRDRALNLLQSSKHLQTRILQKAMLMRMVLARAAATSAALAERVRVRVLASPPLRQRLRLVNAKLC